MSTTAARAIAQSTKTGSIVTLVATPDSETSMDLLVECEDHVDAGDVVEYWGEGWRVHVVTPSHYRLTR